MRITPFSCGAEVIRVDDLVDASHVMFLERHIE
jgi:hypothetical protein